MTYLVPSDWVNGHPPGIARGPMPPLEPIRGDGLPPPPIRGYFGHRPPRVIYKRTRPPYMLDGLGEGETVQQVMAELQKDLKQMMIEQAAISTGITIALNFIPVIGTAASLVFSAIQGLIGSKFQRDAQEVVADTEVQASAIAAEYNSKIQAAQNTAFLREKDSAIQLALSCSNEAAAMNGIGLGDLRMAVHRSALGLQGFSLRKLIKSVVNPIHHLRILTAPAVEVVKFVAPDSVDKVLDKGQEWLKEEEQRAEHYMEVLSGEAMLEEAKKARTRSLALVRENFEEQYQKILADMETPEFRDNLRKSIAHGLLQNAAVATLAKQRCGLNPSAAGNPAIKAPAFDATVPPSSAPLTLAVAGAAALIFIGMKS